MISAEGARNHGLLNVPTEEFFDAKHYLPESADEQRKIADFLITLGRRIEAQQALVENLKKYKRGLLRAYFMTDEWNNHHKWKKCKLGLCCSKIGSGKTPRGGSSVYVNQGVMFLRSQNVLWGNLDISDVSYIDDETNKTMLSSEVHSGDVLLNITGASIGRSCIYSFNDRANVNQHVCILRLSKEGKEKLLPEFLLQQILSDRIQQQVMDCQNGGSREGLNFQQIADFNIVIPDINEQRKICGMLNTFDCKVIREETSLNALLNLRASLMQRLFI
jgi:type I restriction enzyme S subunit